MCEQNSPILHYLIGAIREKNNFETFNLCFEGLCSEAMVNGATNMATSTTMADIIIAQLPLAYLGEKSQVRLTTGIEIVSEGGFENGVE